MKFTLTVVVMIGGILFGIVLADDAAVAQPVQVGTFSSALITFILFEKAYYCEIMHSA